MLNDITLGQYFPGNSPIHRMDPRMKLIAAVLYIIVLFVASRPLGMALGIALVVLMLVLLGGTLYRWLAPRFGWPHDEVSPTHPLRPPDDDDNE